MHRLKTGLKITLTGVFFSASVAFSPVFAQEEVLEETPEEVIEEVVEITPAMAASIFADVPDELIIDRMKCLQNEIKLVYNPKVKGFIDYFTIKNRKYLTVMESRKNVYFPIFEEYLKKHNMPDELKYLSIVESGLNPKAHSRAGAAGLWQFIPSTGKIYNLQQDAYLDERLDPYKSTEAACKYLKQLYNMFNDWELALASYNCGPGNVRRAIRKSGYKETFWEIYNYLPAETRGYVPQFVAVTYVMNHLNDYQFHLDLIEYPMAFDTIMINQTVNIDKLCENLNLCKEDIQKLNPALKRDILPANLKYPLRVPSDVLPAFQENRLAILDSAKVTEEARVAYEEELQPAKIYYTVRRGDYLGKIAAKYGVSTTNIKKWNRMRSSTVHVGEKLAIYTKTTSRSSQSVASNSSSTSQEKSSVSSSKENESKPSKTVYTVRSGDNLHKIAVKYGVRMEDLKKWNDIHGNVIRVGQKLTIHNPSSLSERIAEKGTSPKIYYVQPGDTLWSISKKHTGVSVEDIKKKNNLKDENIKPVMKLIIG